MNNRVPETPAGPETKRVWYTHRAQGEKRCGEASLIASDLELELLQQGREPPPPAIVEGFSSNDRLEQVEAAIELKRWMAMHEAGPTLALTFERIRQTLVRAAGTNVVIATGGAGNPPQTDEDYRAAIGSMLDELRQIYAVIQVRNMTFGRIRLAGLILLVFCFGLLTVTRLLDERTTMDAGVTNYMAVAAAGGLGAIVSIMRRLQSANASLPLSTDPVQQLSALREGYPSLWMAVLTGPIFALALFGLFAGHLVAVSGLTPEFENCNVAPLKVCTPGFFTALNHDFQFTEALDALKMMLWAFVAGFAEKLVPDVLDKISGNLQAGGAG